MKSRIFQREESTRKSDFYGSEFLFHNPLICLGKFLEDFVHTQRFPAEVKDAKTGEYIIANAAVAEISGLTAEEFLGLNAYDVGKINQLQDAVIENIILRDQQVYTQGLFVKYRHVFSSAKTKSVLIEEFIKKPVYNSKNQVIAILGYGQDLTPYVNPIDLFECYQDLHCNILKEPQSVAIQAFLHYFKIDTCFQEIPTKQELITLLAMRKTATSKYVARELGISHRTVEEYKSQLRNKLKVIGLNELLGRLRVRHEYSISTEK